MSKREGPASSKSEGREPSQPFRPIRWWMVLLAVAAVAVMAGLAWVLLTHASRGVTDEAEAAKLRVEVIRTVMTVAAGTGGAMALLLAARRQWLNEHDQLHREQVADHNRHDAAERRITDLYVKAAEQLGSDKAPVRFAGLYALERLAQDTPEHRQTIVEVICAYLRMPYAVPAERDASPEPEATHDQAESVTDKKPDTGYDPLEERQVRLAAQRILARHLRPADGSKFWPDIDIDLSGAVLIDFDLSPCSVRVADFAATTFTGDAWFSGAHFDGDVWFAEATFGGDAWFDDVRFGGDAWFDEARFGSDASFSGASFGGVAAWFYKASFGGNAWFGTSRFGGTAGFEGVTFRDDASFDEVRFGGEARFSESRFGGTAGFEGVTFRDDASFDEVAFNAAASFVGATLRGNRLDAIDLLARSSDTAEKHHIVSESDSDQGDQHKQDKQRPDDS